MHDCLSLAVVDTEPAPLPNDGPLGARYCEVQLVPEDAVITARVAHFGQGSGRGVFTLPAKGDEVLVLFPSGDRQAAIVLGGLGNLQAAHPTTDAGVLVLHPDGIVLKSADALAAEGVVTSSALAALATYLAAFETFMTAISTAATAPQVAAAAVAFMTAVQLAPGTSSPFRANLTASGSGEGGPPYASATVKAGQ